MKWSLRLATVAGIDIKVHATFLLVLAFGAYTWGTGGLRGALFGVVLTLLLFTSVALHELGHSLVAQSVGVRVKQIVLLPIGGVAMMAGRPRKAWHELVIAIAGPAVNVVLAFALGTVALAGVWTGAIDMSGFELGAVMTPSLSTLVMWLLTANVSLAVFNMIPAFPMDGGRVLRALLSMAVGYDRASRFATRLGQVLAVALGGFGLLYGHPMLALIGVFVFFGASQERASDAVRAALTGLHAADVMQRPAGSLASWNRVGDVVRTMIGASQQYYPVVANERVVGVLSLRTAITVVQSGGANLPVEDVMDTPVPVVHARDTVEKVLEHMASNDARVAIVADEQGWVGLVSWEHAIQAAELLRAVQAGDAAAARGRKWTDAPRGV